MKRFWTKCQKVPRKATCKDLLNWTFQRRTKKNGREGEKIHLYCLKNMDWVKYTEETYSNRWGIDKRRVVRCQELITGHRPRKSNNAWVGLSDTKYPTLAPSPTKCTTIDTCHASALQWKWSQRPHNKVIFNIWHLYLQSFWIPLQTCLVAFSQSTSASSGLEETQILSFHQEQHDF